MITQETFDFIKELDDTFSERDPINMNDEESIDLYYMNKLFQYDPIFRIYILTAFCLYMDTTTEQDQKPMTMVKRIRQCLKLMNWMILQMSSEDVLQRILLHSRSASEKLAPSQKV